MVFRSRANFLLMAGAPALLVLTSLLWADPPPSCAPGPIYYPWWQSPTDATVTFTLSLKDDGTGVGVPGMFAIYADVTTDNGGLASFGIDLQGNISSIFNLAPQAYYSRPGRNAFYAGFSAGGEENAQTGKLFALHDKSKE